MEKNEKQVIDATDRNGKLDKNEPNYKGIKAMPFVLGNETCEKLGTLGTSSNLSVYLSSIFHMSTLEATNFVNIFNGTCSLGSLLGAFLSDTYFGRYKTIGFSSVASFLGMLMLTLTAAVPTLHPPDCGKSEVCKEAKGGQMGFLLTGFVLMVIGASGIRPCNLAFGADQFNPNTESGRRGTNSFFNWYYFTYTFSVMISVTIIIYVQTEISWVIGLAIPTILMFLSCVLFFVGSRMYVKVLPQGSPMTSLLQVIVVAIKKRKQKLPEQHICLFNHVPANSLNSKLPYTKQFRFLNKAAILTPEDKVKLEGSAGNPWKLCSIQQVEELKCVIRVIPVWIAGIVYEISYTQVANFVVFQAFQSNRRLFNLDFHIPAATYNVFPMLALTIWLPIYDRLVVPYFRRYTRKKEGITQLQRIGVGIVLSILSMLVSGIVETRRRTIALTRPTLGIEEGKGSISSMSGLWFIPQLSLMGLAQGFAFIGENELFYKQFPENMRSIAAALVLSGVALSSYLSTFLAEIVQKTTRRDGRESWLAQDLNEARLDYFFYLVAAIEVLNLAYFLFCSKRYKYKGTGDGTALETGMEKVGPEKPPV